MERERLLRLELTPDEADELFSRCLKSQDEDNEISQSVLAKLAELVGAPLFCSGHRAA